MEERSYEIRKYGMALEQVTNAGAPGLV